MKAAKLVEVGKIVVEQVEKPKICTDQEVLIKVKAVGLCGTDLHVFKEGRNDVALPRIMGHELSGVVEEIGSNVINVKVGDHVILDPVISCGTCKICLRGHGNVCADVKCFGVQCDGGFQEYIAVDSSKVFAYNENVPFEIAALGEPFSIASNILSRTNAKSGEKVLVIGAGTIGLGIVQAAKGLGAEVLVSDVFDSKLEYAKQFGADAIVNTKTESLEDALNSFAPEGVDIIIDAVGNSALIKMAVELAPPLTRIAVIGFDARSADIPIVHITKKELTLVGSRMNCNQFPTVVEWLNAGVITDKMITKKFEFDDIQSAFEYTLSHQESSIKTMIVMNE